MKKRKKKNIERALLLKNNIIKFNKRIKLPIKINIKFVKSNIIDGVDINIFNSKNIINQNSNLESDDLINKRPMKDVLVKTYRILLFPTDKQKKLLIMWMDAWIEMYNKVVSIIKNERKKQSIALKKVLKYNQMNLDNLKLNKLKKVLTPFKNELNKKYLIDMHTLDYCINDVLTMLKSSISNLKNSNVKKSRLKFIKKTKKSKIFKVEKNSITPSSFFTSKFGKYFHSKPEINFKKKNTRLATIQYINGKFYMLIKKTISIDKEKHKNNKKIISLDPGHKTFLTGLSNDCLLEIGKNIDKKIKKRLVKMDKIKKQKRSKVKNKRKHLLKHEKKISNYINNLHWQTANFLTNNYSHILLGNYSTKSMVESNKTNDMNKRIGNNLKFYQFRQKLIYKSIINNCKLNIVDEYNTTKSCSNCSAINNIGSSREYNCKQCLQLYTRDTNSCKNILLRAIKS